MRALPLDRRSASDGVDMPTYPFICPDGHSIDIVLRFADCDSPQVCECGKPLKRKMASGQSFVMWGGRWRDRWRDSPKERGGMSDGMGPQAE